MSAESSIASPALSPVRSTLARSAALLTMLLGLSAVIGWALDLPIWRSMLPGAVEMKINTAVGLMAASIGLVTACSGDRRLRSGVTGPIAIGLIALGIAELLAYAFGWRLGLDQWLVRDTATTFDRIKGRMSPYSALALASLGVGLLGLSKPMQSRARSIVKVAGGVVAVIGVVAAVGYTGSYDEIVTDRLLPPVAINTALGFVMLGGALLLLGRVASTGPATSPPRTPLESLIMRSVLPIGLLVVVAGGLTYTSGTGFARASARVAQTQEVRAEIGRLHAAIDSAEAASERWRSVGDAASNREFETAVGDVRERLARLGALIADNPAQVDRQRRLVEVVNKRIAALDVGGHAAAPGPRGAGSVPSIGIDPWSPKIRQLTAQTDTAEAARLVARLHGLDRQRVATGVLSLITLAGLVTLFLLLLRGIRREMAARAVAEATTRELNADLERRIAARTAELSSQQAFLRRVIDLDRNLIFANDDDDRFVLANQAVAELLGTSVEAMVGERRRAFRLLDESGSGAADDRRVIDNGVSLDTAEQRIVDAAGKVHWYSVTKQPAAAADGATRIALTVATDITASKSAEDDIRHLNAGLERRVEERTRALHHSNRLLEQSRVEAEAASRAKSAFLANMSHEIRTPMNAIIGLTHLMTRESRDPVACQRLDKIGNAAQHLLGVINDILDLSKIEAGKMVLEDIEFSLDAVMARVFELIGGQARDKGLELLLDTDHLPDRLRGDPTRFSQVLINLLSNAVKFTEEGWVRVRGKVLATDGSRLQFRFEVQDSGPGIPLDRQAGLFSAFEQADTSTTRLHGGTGLGLALTRRLAEAMDGEAGMISEPGAGSTFWFTGWLAEGVEAGDLAAPIRTRGLRVLLVDDLPEALALIGERLRLLGMEVDAQPSGAAALHWVDAEMTAGRPYDLMLIDWRMEPLNGIETLRRLQHLMGDGVPPAILITAFDDTLMRQQADAVHFDAVLVKPITNSALHEALSRVLRRHATGSRADALPMAAVDGAEALLRTRHAGQRVLLAEDNPVNQEVAEGLLRSVGLLVETVGDGLSAVEQAVSRHHDLVLMDVQMPGIDGLEATRRIRAQLGRGMPVIAMTADAYAEQRLACLDAGMNDHVSKPVAPERLFATLLRWLPVPREASARADRNCPPTAPGALGALDGGSLNERLEAIDGLVVDRALRSVGGHDELLVGMLEIFAANYRDGQPRLAGLVGTGDVAGARTILHSLRGAAATVGAVAIERQVLAFEAALTTDLPALAAQTLAGELHASLQALVEAIDHALAG